jgi:hypothetical protein
LKARLVRPSSGLGDGFSRCEPALCISVTNQSSHKPLLPTISKSFREKSLQSTNPQPLKSAFKNGAYKTKTPCRRPKLLHVLPDWCHISTNSVHCVIILLEHSMFLKSSSNARRWGLMRCHSGCVFLTHQPGVCNLTCNISHGHRVEPCTSIARETLILFHDKSKQKRCVWHTLPDVQYALERKNEKNLFYIGAKCADKMTIRLQHIGTSTLKHEILLLLDVPEVIACTILIT